MLCVRKVKFYNNKRVYVIAVKLIDKRGDRGIFLTIDELKVFNMTKRKQ